MRIRRSEFLQLKHNETLALTHNGKKYLQRIIYSHISEFLLEIILFHSSKPFAMKYSRFSARGRN